MHALRVNTQLVSLTLPLNRDARANTRQVEMCTYMAGTGGLVVCFGGSVS